MGVVYTFGLYSTEYTKQSIDSRQEKYNTSRNNLSGKFVLPTVLKRNFLLVLRNATFYRYPNNTTGSINVNTDVTG